MYMFDATVFWIINFCIIILGYLQGSSVDKYALISKVLMVVQGFNIVFLLSAPSTFPLFTLIFALVLTTHHAIINRSEDENAGRCLSLSLSKICNHETWILVCITAALTAAIFTV